VGLPELPEDEVPPGGFRLEVCACEDADIEVMVDRNLLSSDYVHDENLVFNIEGYGRFRLWMVRSG
jgi:hypothetical protein